MQTSEVKEKLSETFSEIEENASEFSGALTWVIFQLLNNLNQEVKFDHDDRQNLFQINLLKEYLEEIEFYHNLPEIEITA